MPVPTCDVPHVHAFRDASCRPRARPPPASAGIQHQPVPTFSYDVSKAAVHSLTRKLSTELAPTITVNAIAPGVWLGSVFVTQKGTRARAHLHYDTQRRQAALAATRAICHFGDACAGGYVVTTDVRT